MKHLFVIRPHSVVDLITNSSSELFIYSGDKSVEVIEDVVKQLIEQHNARCELAKKVSQKDFYEHPCSYDSAIGGVYVAGGVPSSDEHEFYGISYKPGDILISSNGDNSIPWPVQEAISEVLGAVRYHLG